MSMTERKPKYMARVEYRQHQERIEKRLAEGYSQKLVYDELTRDGLLSMSYSAFCDYVRGGGQRLHSRPKKGRGKLPTARSSAAPTATAKPDKSDHFFHDKDVDLKDLI